jgi:MerR family transcriptional regulator, copper efflux regulator
MYGVHKNDLGDEPMATGMTISHAARQAGVGVETIRFYERRRLIRQPARPRSGGYRLYEADVVERIRFVRQAQELGFSLREIAELLSLRADPQTDCGEVRTQAVAKRAEVDRKIAQLQHIRAALDELIATCPGSGALRTCTIIDGLKGRPAKEAGMPLAPDLQSSRGPRRQRATKGSDVKTATFKINGMHCEGCAHTIQTLVSTEPGVRKATVSFKAREAHILFDPRAVSEERLAATIDQAGYSVSGKS